MVFYIQVAFFFFPSYFSFLAAGDRFHSMVERLEKKTSLASTGTVLALSVNQSSALQPYFAAADRLCWLYAKIGHVNARLELKVDVTRSEWELIPEGSRLVS